MTTTGKGLPGYMPKPIEPYCDVLLGVVPCHVGTYSPSGGFKGNTNLYTAVESGALPAGLPARQMSVNEREIPEGHVISEGASSRKRRSHAGKSMVSSCDFTCDSQRGAVYVATSPAKLDELVNPARLRKYIQNAKAVYPRADSIREIADDNPLSIVTGCIKSDSYAIAAFRETNNDPMSLENFTCGGDVTPTFDWTSLPRSGEGKFGSSGERGLKNETFFLRGFKLDSSHECQSRLKGRPRPWNGAPGDDLLDPYKGPRPAGDDRQGEKRGGSPRGAGNGGGFGSGWWSSTGSTGTNFGGGSQDVEALSDDPILDRPRDDEVGVHSFFTSDQDTYHPSDTINKHLLDATGAGQPVSHVPFPEAGETPLKHFPSSERRRGRNIGHQGPKPETSGIIILLMGQTGAGKSHFLNSAMGVPGSDAWPHTTGRPRAREAINSPTYSPPLYMDPQMVKGNESKRTVLWRDGGEELSHRVGCREVRIARRRWKFWVARMQVIRRRMRRRIQRRIQRRISRKARMRTRMRFRTRTRIGRGRKGRESECSHTTRRDSPDPALHAS
ncbi:hypothetical protein FA13DRAFT_592345 [Coprinellus micaceus]|uniref:Uncharacterized protein n=1 Tax=Coprinellus micaceus TaxID=71717 RepID=A0A4Y7SCB8_COPMI|nr:hypothetical protein FA13DRAFT_592345 [Coprinellus micaceus]